MRIRALTVRILNQLRNDKWTVMLVLAAPVLILTLVYFILDTGSAEYRLGIINAPDDFVSEVENNDNVTVITEPVDEKDVISAIDDGDIVAAVDIDENYENIKIQIDGTNSSDAKKVTGAVKTAVASLQQEKIAEITEAMGPAAGPVSEPGFFTDYIYGSEDQSFFDNFGAPLVGIIIFFFAYLLAGINFLGERTSGTLEKVLSTPIRRVEIIMGYVVGFSILALIQTAVVTVFVIYALGVTLMGSIWYVMLINLLTSITALTLGILLSTLAKNEFQVVQFIPVVILPQVFLCGMFDLPGGWSVAGRFIPLHYTTDALQKVMLRGDGFDVIWGDCAVLAGCAVFFVVLNVLLLKRQRAI